ncbi:hypothetical protein GCM10010261_55640 [Streptomyces pilosus]|nr:hypothetical protein GCM10010261_55640 [Streptomyces pilosus]
MPGGGRNGDRGRGGRSVQHTGNANLRFTGTASDPGPNRDLGPAPEPGTGPAQPPQKPCSAKARGNGGKTTQLFTFSCDLSHKGQILLTLCTEWAARCDSVAGKLVRRYAEENP